MSSRSRSSRASKTLNERSGYYRYIRQLESQPTVAEPSEIDPSFEAKEELAEPRSKRERTIPLGLRLRDHFEKNWISWLLGAVIFVASFLVLDARTNIAILSHDLSNQQQSLDKIDTSLHENANADHDRDLLIEEIRIRLEYLVNGIKGSSATDTPIKSPVSTPTPTTNP